jgi:hypothetical protein
VRGEFVTTSTGTFTTGTINTRCNEVNNGRISTKRRPHSTAHCDFQHMMHSNQRNRSASRG